MNYWKFFGILNFILGYLTLYDVQATTTIQLYDSVAYSVPDDAKYLSKQAAIQYQINLLDTFDWNAFQSISKLGSVQVKGKSKIWLKLVLKANQNTVDNFYIRLAKHEKSKMRFYNPQHQLLDSALLGELHAKIRGIPTYLQEVAPFRCVVQDSIYCIIELSNMTRNHLKRDIVPTLYASRQSLKNAYHEALVKHLPRMMYHFLVFGFYLFQILWTTLQCIEWKQKREFLYYLGYLTTLFIYFFCHIDGLDSVNLFFPYHPTWYVHVNKAMPILAYWMYSRFFDHFFDVKQHYPGIYRLMQVSESILLFALISGFFVTSEWLTAEIQSLLVGILVPISVVVFGRVWYDKRQSIFNMVMVGTCIFIISATITYIWSTKPQYLPNCFRQTIVEDEPLIFLGFGVILEMICLSIALTRKAYKTDRDLYRAHSNYFHLTHNVLKGKIRVLNDKILAAYSTEQPLKDHLLKQVDDLNLAFDFVQGLSNQHHPLDNLGALVAMMDKHFKCYFDSNHTKL